MNRPTLLCRKQSSQERSRSSFLAQSLADNNQRFVFAPVAVSAFRMAISVTSPEARKIQLRIHRSMSAEERVLIALEMSLFAQDLARERICSEHQIGASGR